VDGETLYLNPSDPFPFAETLIASGDCTTYTDHASLIGPLSVTGSTSTYTASRATLTTGQSVTIQYSGAIAGALPEGSYSLVHFPSAVAKVGGCYDICWHNGDLERWYLYYTSTRCQSIFCHRAKSSSSTCQCYRIALYTYTCLV